MTQEYIITEEELDIIFDLLKRNAFYQSVIDEHLDPVYNRLYNPQAERERVLDELERWLEDYLDTGYEGSADEIKTIKKKINKLRRGEK